MNWTDQPQEKTEVLGVKRLLKALKYSHTPEEFVQELVDHPKWYLCNKFLRDQKKPYFIEFYNYYKGGK